MSRRTAIAGIAATGAGIAGLSSVGAFSSLDVGRFGDVTTRDDATALLQITESGTSTPIGSNTYTSPQEFDFTNASTHSLDVSLSSGTGMNFSGSTNPFTLASGATQTVTFENGNGQETVSVSATGTSQDISFDRTITLEAAPPVWANVNIGGPGNGDTTVEVATTSDVVTGDLLVVIIATDKQYAISRPNANWTEINADPSTHNGAPSIKAFHRDAPSDGINNFTFNVGHKNAVWRYAAIRITGHSATPIDSGSTNSTSSGNNTVQTLTLNSNASTSNTLFVESVAMADTTGGVTPPGSTMERWDIDATSPPEPPSFWGASESAPPTGTQSRNPNWATGTSASGVAFNIK